MSTLLLSFRAILLKEIPPSVQIQATNTLISFWIKSQKFATLPCLQLLSYKQHVCVSTTVCSRLPLPRVIIRGKGGEEGVRIIVKHR
jgi:hypothetical protein